MITEQDITKLKKVFVTKEELADLRVEVGEIRDGLLTVEEKMDQGFDALNVKLDKFLGTVDVLEMDNSAGATILYRHERQIQALVDHTGITLPQE